MHSISSESPDNGVSNLFLLGTECVSTSNMYIMLGKSYPIHKVLMYWHVISIAQYCIS